jgi:hypothetical protein
MTPEEASAILSELALLSAAVREAAFERDEARGGRDYAICEARKDGATLQAIADVVGLSRGRVSQILKTSGDL